MLKYPQGTMQVQHDKFNKMDTKILELFKNYIEIDTSGTDGLNYRSALNLIGDYLETIDFKNEFVDIPEEVAGNENRVNLISRKHINNKFPTLLVYSHIDVVPANYADAYKFKIDNEKVYGRGSSDHKGGTIAVLDAISKLNPENLKYNLILWFTVDEETDQMEQLNYATPFLKLPKNTIVFDTDTFAGGITVARLGSIYFGLKIKGKSVHSAMSNLGRNAVEDSVKIANYFITKIKPKYETQKSEFNAFKSSGLDKVCSRCNINILKGGIAHNIIPDECELGIEFRFIPEINVTKEKKKLLKLIEKFCAKNDISYEITKIVEWEGHGSKSMEADKFNSIYSKYSSEAGIYCILGSCHLSQWSKENKLIHFGLGVARGDTHVHGVGEFAYIKDIEILSRTFGDYLTA